MRIAHAPSKCPPRHTVLKLIESSVCLTSLIVDFIMRNYILMLPLFFSSCLSSLSVDW